MLSFHICVSHICCTACILWFIALMDNVSVSTFRDFHPESVFTSMETIMSLVLEESEDISSEILAPLLRSVKKENRVIFSLNELDIDWTGWHSNFLESELDEICFHVTTIMGDTIFLLFDKNYFPVTAHMVEGLL